MATSVRQFNIELYEEHLEEASFLYEQRLVYLEDAELTWLDLDEYEKRHDAHLDGLIIGKDLALAVCNRRAKEGDFGELHAAASIFCRQRRKDLLFELLRDFDGEDPDSVIALSNALIQELPSEWSDDLMKIIVGRHHKVIPVLARTLGYRRLGSANVLSQVLKTSPDEFLPHVIWALGRIGDTAARGVLFECLRSETQAVCEAASLALLRMGDEQPVKQAMLLAQLHEWPANILALGGGRSAVNVLKDIANSDKASEACLLGLGLLGDCAAVALLVDKLNNPDLAPAAALGLQLITGAQLYEDVFVPEEIGPDELFDEEREKYEQTGELPTRADGEPFGSTARQLSVNPQLWRKWLAENKNGFDPSRRYRYGKLYAPQTVLETLAAEFTPYRVRSFAAEELRVRYGADFPFEADMPVNQQKHSIRDMAVWMRGDGQKFKPGEWYFAGRPIQ